MSYTWLLSCDLRISEQVKSYDFMSCAAILKSQTQQEYYFVGELATPLLTMYETYYFGLCGMTKDQLYAERDAFYSTLKAILSHPDNAECNDQFKLLYWSDPETGVRLSIVLIETQDELSAYFKLCICM